MRSKIAATAALAAAAVALSACTSQAGHSAPVAAGDTVISTAGQTPEATAAALHEAEKNDAALRMAAASAHDNWINVTGQGVIVKDSSSQPTQFGATPKPGVVILSNIARGNSDMCTLGPAIRKENGTGDGFATAGHCGKNDPMQRLQVDSFFNGPASTIPLGALTDREDNGYTPVNGVLSDSAALWSGAVGPSAVRIADTWPVAGVMAMDSVKNLPKGTSVCLDGTVSGVLCGPLEMGDVNGLLRFRALSHGGDSGSPVFLIDGDTHAATLVGLIEGGDGVSAYATYLEPALTRLGAQALVDPTSAATVAGDSRYSTRVSPLN